MTFTGNLGTKMIGETLSQAIFGGRAVGLHGASFLAAVAVKDVLSRLGRMHLSGAAVNLNIFI